MRFVTLILLALIPNQEGNVIKVKPSEVKLSSTKGIVDGRIAYDPANGFHFFPGPVRAKCLRVIDGDTIDVLLDVGFHAYRRERLRLNGIDTPELRSKSPRERQRANTAKDVVRQLTRPEGVVTEWPLLVVAHKDDAFGRLVADVWLYSGDKRIHLNAELLKRGLAVPYKRKRRSRSRKK